MALGDGQTQGDGKTSPFGNGKGGTGGTMAGNDFVKNPAGGNPGTRGNNFNENPAGAGPTGATPANVMANPNDKQKQGPAADLNPESEIKDQGLLVPLADVPASRKDLVGVGSMGDSRKPFKLSGG